jgi:acyl-CoA thioesterase
MRPASGRTVPAVAGSAVYPGLAAVSGVEQLQAFLSGRAPAPPVGRLTGRRIVDASRGSATYALPATGWMLGPSGFVHSGALALLADGALVAAVISGLPPRTLCTTAELSMTYLARLPAGHGEVTARGRLLHLDGEMGLAEVFVHDAGDRAVAHGTSRCTVFSAIDASVELQAPAAAPEPAPDTPDPYRRPVPATDATPAPFERDGLDVLRAQLRGELLPPPIDQLIGIRLAAAEPGRVEFTLPAHGWLGNEWGTVYGGVTTLLAKSAAAAAVQTTAAAGTRFTALDIKVNMLRPIALDGRELVATGTLLHRGRRLAIATAQVMHGEKRVAVATGTTALTPTRPAG